jgi:hypothetical protein
VIRSRFVSLALVGLFLWLSACEENVARSNDCRTDADCPDFQHCVTTYDGGAVGPSFKECVWER